VSTYRRKQKKAARLKTHRRGEGKCAQDRPQKFLRYEAEAPRIHHNGRFDNKNACDEGSAGALPPTTPGPRTCCVSQGVASIGDAMLAGLWRVFLQKPPIMAT
jgi:hypothetical protein